MGEVDSGRGVRVCVAWQHFRGKFENLMEAAWWLACNTEDRKITFIWSQIRWSWFRQWMLTQKWMRWFCFILRSLISLKNCHATAYIYTSAPQEGLVKRRHLLLLFLLGWHLSQVCEISSDFQCIPRYGNDLSSVTRLSTESGTFDAVTRFCWGEVFQSETRTPILSAIQNVECMIQEWYALRCCFTINSHPGGFCTSFPLQGNVWASA